MSLGFNCANWMLGVEEMVNLSGIPDCHLGSHGSLIKEVNSPILPQVEVWSEDIQKIHGIGKTSVGSHHVCLAILYKNKQTNKQPSFWS